MKKFLILLLSIILVVCASLFVACTPNSGGDSHSTPRESVTSTDFNGGQSDGERESDKTTDEPTEDSTGDSTDKPIDSTEDPSDKPTVCNNCGNVIENYLDHQELACGHMACSDGEHDICETCGEYLCNGLSHSHDISGWCEICGFEILEGDDSHSTFMTCGHNKCLQRFGDHTKCLSCDGFVCDGNLHDHVSIASIDSVKNAIDENPNGVYVAFKGFVIGEDARGRFHVADESEAIYVRAYSGNCNVEIGDYVQVKGRGYVYRGSEDCPEYTRQIDEEGVTVTKLESGAIEVMTPMLITKDDLETTSESADISNPIHGNPVQITGYLSVGDDIYSYYLLDEDGNKLVGLHHASQHFNESTHEYRNLFNAFDGQEITLTGVIYRYYTAENIWTFQYISRVEPCSQAEDVIDGVRYEMSGDGTYAIAKESVYGDFRQVIEIASHFKGLAVEEIDEYCFSGKDELLRVIIPSTVRVIGEMAFVNCKYLNEVKFLEGGRLTLIDRYAFENCKNLKLINLPSSLTTIAYLAFKNTGFTQITLPSGLENVGSNAFEGCENLEKVNFEGSVDEWAKINFENEEAHPMSIVDSISFGGQAVGEKLTLTSATTIGRLAFYNFSSVTEIVLPTTVTNIGYGAFKGCDRLVELTMPCIELGFYSYSNNSRLQLLFGEREDIPTTLTTVVFNQAERVYTAYFRGCGNIEKVVLPETITVIEDCAFEDCTAISSVNLPNAVTMINSSAFKNCASLTQLKLPTNLEIIDSWAFAFSGITTVKIPFKTTHIGSSAFRGCESLKTIYIHSGIEYTGEDAFESPITTVYFTGADTWEDFTQEVGYYYTYLPGTKVRVSTYTLG